jgi:hypothetical protein
MFRGAHDPEWIADGLSQDEQEALIDIRPLPSFSKAVEGWRGPLTILERGKPPHLTPQGKAVRNILLSRRAERQTATAIETDVIDNLRREKDNG